MPSSVVSQTNSLCIAVFKYLHIMFCLLYYSLL